MSFEKPAEQPMVVPELHKKEKVRIEEVYVSAPETPSALSKIKTFLTPPSIESAPEEASVPYIEDTEEKTPPEHVEPPQPLAPVQERVMPPKALAELPHTGFESILGEKVQERRPVTQEEISAKTREIYMKRLAGREPGYTYHEMDEMLKRKGIRPNTSQAREFFGKWDRERAENILHEESVIAREPAQKRAATRKTKK